MPRHSPLAALLRRYGIADVLGFKPLDEGLLNRAFLVSTGSGRLFLKHYLDQEPHTIRAQHAATAALAERGLPVVAPLADLSGRTLNHYGSRSFALYPWVHGEHRPGLTLELEQCRALGALLGRLHDALADILGPAAQPLAQPTTQVAEARAKALRLLELLRDRPVREGIDDLAEFRLVERLGLLDTCTGISTVSTSFTARTARSARWWTGTGSACSRTARSWCAQRSSCSSTRTTVSSTSPACASTWADTSMCGPGWPKS
jgi:hypothetical protein